MVELIIVKEPHSQWQFAISEMISHWCAGMNPALCRQHELGQPRSTGGICDNWRLEAPPHKEKGMVLKLAFELFGVEFRKETLALLLIEIPFHYFLIFLFNYGLVFSVMLPDWDGSWEHFPRAPVQGPHLLLLLLLLPCFNNYDVIISGVYLLFISTSFLPDHTLWST